jgi:DNA-binding PadR family transcriptional regulator
MATIAKHFSEASSIRDKILYVLSLMHKGSAAEIAAEIVELQGIASEEEVAEIAITIEQELEKLCEEGVVNELREHRQKKRYLLTGV